MINHLEIGDRGEGDRGEEKGIEGRRRGGGRKKIGQLHKYVHM